MLLFPDDAFKDSMANVFGFSGAVRHPLEALGWAPRHYSRVLHEVDDPAQHVLSSLIDVWHSRAWIIGPVPCFIAT